MGMVQQRKELEILIRTRDEATKEFLRMKKNLANIRNDMVGAELKGNKALANSKKLEMKEASAALGINQASLALTTQRAKVEEKAFHNARKFKMEYLSIMFGMMSINRVIVSFLRSAIQTYKIATNNQGAFIQQTNKLNAAWTFLKFRLIDALGQSDLFIKVIDFVIGLVEAIADLDDEELQKIGERLLLIAGLTGLAVVAASMGLLAGGIKMLATDVIWKTVTALEALTAAKLSNNFVTLAGTVGRFALRLLKWGLIIALVGTVFKSFIEGFAHREVTWGEIFSKMGDGLSRFGSLVSDVIGVIVESIKFLFSVLGLLVTGVGETIDGAWNKISGKGGFDYTRTKELAEGLKTENWKNREDAWFKPETGDFQLDESGKGWGLAAQQELANIDLSNLEILKEASEATKSTIGSLQSSIGTSWLTDLDFTTENLGDNVRIMGDEWGTWADMMNNVLDKAGDAEAVLGTKKSLTPVVMLLTEKTTLAHQEFGTLHQELNSVNTISVSLDGTMLMLNQTTITLTDSTNLEAEAHRNNAQAINEQAQAYRALANAIRAYYEAKSRRNKYRSRGES